MELNNLHKIKHLVVLMQENRSFDHVLGARPGVNGVAGTAARGPLRGSSRFSRFEPGPPHDSAGIKMQINGGAMDGFIEAYRNPPDGKHKDPANPQDVARFYEPNDLPVTSFLADRFAVCDAWFSSIPTSTMPNRLYSMAGHSGGERETPVDLGVPVTTVFDLLEAKGVSWRIYSSGLSMLLFVGNLGKKLDNLGKIKPRDRLKQDCLGGTLPTVSWVEPNWDWLPGANDDHPPAPIEAGQNLIRETYLSVAFDAGVAWDDTVFVVTYDEHGGFYDHVSPPQVPVKQDDGFETLGPRVPAIIASPYVAPGSVIGAKQAVQLDHCSVLKFICEWQGLAPGDLSPRVAHQDTQSLRLVLTDTPQARAPLPPDELPVPAPPVGLEAAAEVSPLQANFRALGEHVKKTTKDSPEHKPLRDLAARIK